MSYLSKTFYASLLLIVSNPGFAETLALVTGFARSFLSEKPITDATITVLETGQQVKTDKEGRYSLNYPVGQALTLKMKKSGFKTTLSDTVLVPSGGLTNRYNNITFQVPSIEAYYVLAMIIGAKIDDNSCHVTSTITAYHKTLDDIPQGESGATVTLSPAVNEVPFYFDIFKDGPFKGKTNPFTHGLTATSEDGGVAFFNLPPRAEPYVISAIKPGKVFTSAIFICKKGEFINISPPRGPMALQ